MTVPLTGAGGLFTRLGHLFGGLDDIQALRGGPATVRVLSGANWVSRAGTIGADYLNGTALQQVIDGLYTALGGWQSAAGGIFGWLKSTASNTIVQMVNNDSPLSSVDLRTALQVLIGQMQTAGASVNASSPAVGNQTAVGVPNGNPILVASVKNGQGLTLQYVFPETLTFSCTADSQGGATLGQEPLSVKGPAAVSDELSYLWPGGSGVSTSLNAVDASKNNSAGNLLQNSAFEVFTSANIPDNWTLGPGAAGVDIFNGGSGNAYTGSGCLQFTGTGAALLDAVTQQFGVTPTTTVGAGGTAATLKPDTIYAVNCWLKTSATPTAGVLELALVDGTGTVINDDQTVANLATRTLTNIGTTWIAFNAVFRTPAVLPAIQRLRVRLSTAIDSGKSVFVDRLGMNAMTQLYAPAGPFVSIFSGSNKLILNDSWTVAVSNTYGAFQKAFERVFGMRQLGLQLPASGTPTITDSLIA